MLLSRIQHDKALLQELITLFQEDTPILLAHMADALLVGDGYALSRHAHEMKGNCMNIGAGRMKKLASTLERKGKLQELEGADVTLANLRAEYKQVNAALEALLAQMN